MLHTEFHGDHQPPILRLVVPTPLPESYDDVLKADPRKL
jgi:hypothetical protein